MRTLTETRKIGDDYPVDLLSSLTSGDIAVGEYAATLHKLGLYLGRLFFQSTPIAQ